MNDLQPDFDNSIQGEAASTGESLGRHLARLRQEQGLSVTDVAQATKFSPRQIEALEHDDLAALPPGSTFVRGFVRSYAKFLRTDAESLLALLAVEAPTLAPAELLKPEDTGAHLPQPHGTRNWTPILAGAALAAAVVALGMHYFYRGKSPASGPQTAGMIAAEPIGAAPASAVTTLPPAAASSETTASAPGDLSASSATMAQSPVPVAVLQPQPQTVPTEPTPAVQPPALAAAAPAPAMPAAVAPRTVAGHQLVFRFEDKSWVEVKDASQRVVFAQMNAPGSRQVVSGRPPFQVVIGNANHVRLDFDDRPVDLAPYIRAAVARLTVQ